MALIIHPNDCVKIQDLQPGDLFRINSDLHDVVNHIHKVIAQDTDHQSCITLTDWNIEVNRPYDLTDGVLKLSSDQSSIEFMRRIKAAKSGSKKSKPGLQALLEPKPKKLNAIKDRESSTVVPVRLSELELTQLDRLVENLAAEKYYQRVGRSTVIAQLISRAFLDLMAKEDKKHAASKSK